MKGQTRSGGLCPVDSWQPPRMETELGNLFDCSHREKVSPYIQSSISLPFMPTASFYHS